MLPPHFAFMETANDINEISTIENINKKLMNLLIVLKTLL